MMDRVELVLLLDCITPLLIVVCSTFLSYVSLRRWLKEPYNHEQIFYWGISFAIIAFTFTNALISLYTTMGIENSLVMHIWIGLALWFQLFAIAAVRDNQPPERKKLRLIMWSAFFIVITMLVILAIGEKEYATLPIGIFEMQILSNQALDLFFELLYTAAILSILMYLMPIRNILYSYFSLYLAFLILLVSRIINILNIVVFKFNNFCIVITEWVLIVLAFIYLTVSVYRLINENK